MAMPQIICFGECMLELSQTILGGAHWSLAAAGDTYNVAVYLKRLGNEVGYMTALGRDQFSNRILTAWSEEGLNSDLVVSHPTRIPGLYAICLDEQGERSFEYWRGESAARAFFKCNGAPALLHHASRVSVLYLSGITLSLFSDAERQQVAALAERVRTNGGDVVFDSNYRAKGWPDAITARRAFEAFAKHVSVSLPTFEDDRAVFGDETYEICARRWLSFGAREVVVKLGSAGAYVANRTETVLVTPERIFSAKDTTGAGDSFNAAYISSRRNGNDIRTAVQAGNRLAGAVVQQPGAIIRRVHMPSFAKAGISRASPHA